ncbi:hypothetical protein [Marinicellulosiphila megalodicopiae]|uniref:hypothetical protein n=1 Tax=Marinicellulosiphila megalodicopiae TaxID=2724896 RepID=UPI003BAF5D5A
MFNSVKKTIMSTAVAMGIASSACAQSPVELCETNWIDKSDEIFAKDCADMAFSDDLKDRQKVAWMFDNYIDAAWTGSSRPYN